MYRARHAPRDRIRPGIDLEPRAGLRLPGVAFTGKGDTVTAERRGPPGVRISPSPIHRIPRDPASRNTAAIAASAVWRKAGNNSRPRALRREGPAAFRGHGRERRVRGRGGPGRQCRPRRGPPDRSAPRSRARRRGGGGRAARRQRRPFAPRRGCPRHGGGGSPPRLCRVRVHPCFALVLVTPSYEVLTAAARAVLPTQIARADAVTQAATLAGLVLGLERGEVDSRGRLDDDRIAEPVRAPLYPGTAEARAAALDAGAVGVTVSGAGPTLVAIVPAKLFGSPWPRRLRGRLSPGGVLRGRARGAGGRGRRASHQVTTLACFLCGRTFPVLSRINQCPCGSLLEIRQHPQESGNILRGPLRPPPARGSRGAGERGVALPRADPPRPGALRDASRGGDGALPAGGGGPLRGNRGPRPEARRREPHRLLQGPRA